MSAPPLPKPVWFTVGTRDLLGVSVVSLGHVILSPWEPQDRLNNEKPASISNSLTRERPDESDWSWTSNTQKTLSAGIFANFLQLLGLEANLKGGIKQNYSISYRADKLATEEFFPDETYLEKILQDTGVRNAFTAPRPRSKVFLVTGLKKAYGAIRIIESDQERSSNAELKMRGPALGELGSEAHTSFQVGERLSSGKLDFIFGLKVRLLTYKNGHLASKSHQSGASYDLDDSESEDEVLDLGEFKLEDVVDGSEDSFFAQSRDVTFKEDGFMKEVRLFHPEEGVLRELGQTL